MDMKLETHILNLSCKDQVGIVAKISSILAESNCNIVESKQFTDQKNGNFFIRQSFLLLNDEMLPNLKIKAVVSNHKTAEEIANFSNIPFHYLPIEKSNKLDQEKKLKEIINNNDVQLIVLARYMQVLSEEFTNYYAGKIINIHHSFLPSFKGARPYHQAFERGVKVIGATAHYVTKDLDEGPIIEQDTQEVNHEMMPSDLVLMGRDIEARVLYRAIKAHSERRVFLNDNRTIVFRGQRI